MNIYIPGISAKDQRAVDHIVRLFFEEPKLVFEEPDSWQEKEHRSSIKVDINMQDKKDSLLFVATLTQLVSPQVVNKPLWEATHPISLSNEWSAETKRKRIKQGKLHVLLQVFEDYTGLKQPWGILTGIRPTKLWHRKSQEGRTSIQIEQELTSETRISADKLQLMRRIVGRQRSAIPDLYALKQEVSLYIGIPYCPTKCAYCTFPAYAIGGQQNAVNQFLFGLHEEFKAVGQWLKEHDVRVTTVYFGGGTPTSITADEMDRLYDWMWRTLPYPDEIREVTVEAGRPDTITNEKLQVLRKWNIDRISINPQSYNQATLQAIGRHHTVEETIEKYWLARQMGMTNINMDLIIGLPGEGQREFEYTLEQTALLMPESLTVHTLSFKRASEMTQNKDKYKVADRDEVTAMMNRAAEWTAQHKYEPYYLYRQKNILGNLENVGYATPGRESLYNILIMEELQTIIGIGCGASSKWIDPQSGNITRSANPKDPRTYNASYLRYTEDKLDKLSHLFAMR